MHSIKEKYDGGNDTIFINRRVCEVIFLKPKTIPVTWVAIEKHTSLGRMTYEYALGKGKEKRENEILGPKLHDVVITLLASVMTYLF